jgi:uncharacterized metal-binding protein
MKMMNKENKPDCAHCTMTREERICLNKKGRAQAGCPTANGKSRMEQVREQYHNDDILEFARQASIQEGECYAGRDQKPYVLHPTKTRIEEICEFAVKMNYKRLGLVFCAGLAREARVFADVMEKRGFDVFSVICKVGCVPKEDIGLKDDEKIYIGQHESMCNPIAQAMVVNEAGVQFNILLGLCVGHDSLFFKYAEAPVTVLAVKDRVTGHNPLAALYLLESYYARIKDKG